MCWGFDPAIFGTVASWVVPPLCVGLAAYAAFKYQNLSKMKEFQFQAFKEAVFIRTPLASAVWHYYWLRLTLDDIDVRHTVKGDHHREKIVNAIAESEQQAEELLQKADALDDVLPHLFSPETAQHWTEIYEAYRNAILKVRIGDIKECLEDASKEWGEFFKCVRREIHLPLRRGRERKGQQSDALLKIESKNGSERRE